MSFTQAQALGMIILLTLISGIADAKAFTYAAAIWQDGRLVWSVFGKSALGFLVGIGAFWLSVRYMQKLGVVTPELQTLIWFGVTLVGVAMISGRAFRWPLVDQIVGVLVLCGIGWLLARTSG